MKHVPIAKFKDRVSEYIAEAEAGDEIIVTRHGKIAARVLPPEVDKDALRREAVEKIRAFGQKYLAKYGPTSSAQIRQWIEEGRDRDSR
jgi:prevent-host-death family protein